MLYYLLFWTLLGFIIHFYIIFGTNLLTGGPAQICCFMPISVFRGKGISDGVKTKRNQLEKLFLEGKQPGRLGVHVKKATREARGRGARPPSRRALHPHGPLVAPLTYFFLLYIPTYPQTNRDRAKNLIPPPQLSVSTRSHLGACSGAPLEEASITEGFYIIIQAPPMKCE